MLVTWLFVILKIYFITNRILASLEDVVLNLIDFQIVNCIYLFIIFLYHFLMNGLLENIYIFLLFCTRRWLHNCDISLYFDYFSVTWGTPVPRTHIRYEQQQKCFIRTSLDLKLIQMDTKMFSSLHFEFIANICRLVSLHYTHSSCSLLSSL